MILLLHITIALASVGLTTYAFFNPSQTKLRTAYGLVALTLISGTALVAVSQAHILQACVSGLIYVGAVSLGLVGVRYKLARKLAGPRHGAGRTDQ